MRKHISILCTLVVLVGNVQLIEVKAESGLSKSDITIQNENIGTPYLKIEDSIVNTVEDTENPDLYALASSLGADTDYFNFLNYTSESLSDKIRQQFDHQRNQLEIITSPIDLIPAVNVGGVCHGISVLQVLVHNGIISASDIQEGAETLNDIVFDEKVNDILTYYQMSQLYNKQKFAIKSFFCNNDTADQCQSLIEHAKRAMEENKYFYITFQTTSFAHAIVGIGIADGNWIYNDKSYDKCILTLDSNVATPDKTGAYGFNKDACIFINSETNEFYIPGYKSGNEDGTFISFVTDDETLLNYRGMINPSETVETDTSIIKGINIFNHKKCEYDLTVANGDSFKIYHGTPDEELGICKNNWVDKFSGETYFIKSGEEFKINVGSSENEGFQMGIFDENISYLLNTTGKCEYNAEFSDNKISVINKENEKSACIIEMVVNKGEYNSFPYAEFKIEDNFPETLTLENTTDGVCISDTNGLDGYIDFTGLIVDEEGYLHYADDYTRQFEGDCGYQVPMAETFRITGDIKSVLIKYNEETNKPQIWFDIDDDGIYETPHTKGDVNTDGVLNASDASTILSVYAELSSGVLDFGYRHNPYICDYNGDNALNSADASQVLAYYAEISSGKNE